MYKGTIFPVLVDLLHPHLLQNYDKLTTRADINSIILDKVNFTEDTLLITSICKLLNCTKDTECLTSLIESLKLNILNYPSIKFNDDIINFVDKGELIETYKDKYIYMFLPFAHNINSIRNFNINLDAIFSNSELIKDINFFIKCIFVLNTYRRNDFLYIKSKFKNFIKEQRVNLKKENKNLYIAITIFLLNNDFELMFKEIYSLNIHDTDKKHIAMLASCFAGTIYEINSNNLMNLYSLTRGLNKEIITTFNDFHNDIQNKFREKWSPISLTDIWHFQDLFDCDRFTGIKSQNINIEEVRDDLSETNPTYKKIMDLKNEKQLQKGE